MGGAKIFLILVVAAFAFALLTSGPDCTSGNFGFAGICQHKLHGASCPNLQSTFALAFFAPFIGLAVLSIWPLGPGPAFKVLKPPR